MSFPFFDLDRPTHSHCLIYSNIRLHIRLHIRNVANVYYGAIVAQMSKEIGRMLRV